MGRVKTQRRVIICDSAAHSQQSNVHHAKGQGQKRGSHQPEVHFSPKLVHAPARSLRVPKINRREEREYESAKDRVMEVPHDPISIMQMQVKSDHGIGWSSN